MTAFLHLCNIALSQSDVEKLVHTFLVYCNPLLSDYPKNCLKRLQLIQHAAASYTAYMYLFM